MNRRKIQALRNLAERPGTEAEGIVAREMLAKLENKSPEEDLISRFRRFLRTGNLDDLPEGNPLWQCVCGTISHRGQPCSTFWRHHEIKREMETRFPVGSRVYYNYWAYNENCSATVIGYSGDWNCIRLKFAHLKSRRNVPIYRHGYWHLSLDPLSHTEAFKLGRKVFISEATR